MGYDASFATAAIASIVFIAWSPVDFDLIPVPLSGILPCGRLRGESLPNSCQTHAPKGGRAKPVETYWSKSQMLAKEKDRLVMAALVNLGQLGANRLKFGC
jgi:hypothetical protein